MSEGLNQFLIIHDSNKPKAYIFENINCDTMMKKEYEKKNNLLGNPILDVFYGAKLKFGEYKNYTTRC
jgi:hypothetical protein